MSNESDLPIVPFAIGMSSLNGCPPFMTLVFDDGVAVPLHAVLPLAARLGLHLPRTTLFDFLADWSGSLDALARLVQALAYDDRARGHRGQMMPEGLLHPEAPLPEARHIFDITDGKTTLRPVTVQVSAGATISLDDSGQTARLSPGLAAVVGGEGIAGWLLGVSLIRDAEASFGALGLAGSLALGPLFLPEIFARDEEAKITFGVMGRVVSEMPVAPLKSRLVKAAGHIISHVRCLPGDIIFCGTTPDPDLPKAGMIDMLELTAPGLGHAQVSLT